MPHRAHTLFEGSAAAVLLNPCYLCCSMSWSLMLRLRSSLSQLWSASSGRWNWTTPTASSGSSTARAPTWCTRIFHGWKNRWMVVIYDHFRSIDKISLFYIFLCAQCHNVFFCALPFINKWGKRRGWHKQAAINANIAISCSLILKIWSYIV